ncbi:putative Nrap protein domain 1 [Helianthus annuus]|nr:putative Nrap protein domain 1 [Helianthus annuus]KAJ0707878.1 putative Nrap protein domain 1 [Helianthus annuus]KAJ0711856.1 putative Nrap protein domain 1 [Helianthus annuus]
MVFWFQECFHEKDFLNHRYHGKRCLYLCIIKKYLESSSVAQKVEWSFFQNEARKPILVVYPGVSEATPMYNNSVLEDMFMEQGAEFIKTTFTGWKALQEALVLLKVWARQRSSLNTHDSVNGYLISIIMAYLASESGKARLNKAMTVMQIFRITLDFIASSKLWGNGIFIKPQGGSDMSKEERKKYVKYFPVVLCDLSAHFNLAYRMTMGGLNEVSMVIRITFIICSTKTKSISIFSTVFILLSYFFVFQLQAEAALALRCIDKCKEGGFVELFMTKVDFPAKFDYCMRLNLKGKTEVSAQGFCLDNECWRLYEDKVHSLLKEGLGDRVKSVRVTWQNATSTRCINDALKFRKFWGDVAELYQFKSGTRECVFWECKPAKRYLIIKNVTEYVLKRHLSLAEDKIMHAVDQLDFSLACEGGDLASDGSLLESFGTLSKRLRLLSDVPLAISSVQPLDSAFRHTSVFPPQPHPLANGTKAGNRISSTCLPSMEVMIQLEGSGNWPMDDAAIEKTKAAFLLRIGECLEKDYGMKWCPSEEGVDVFLSGYVFRLKILHERGLDLLNGQGKNKVSLS